MRTWQKRSERNRFSLFFREVDAMLISSAKIPGREGSISPIKLLWATAPLLVPRVRLIFIVDEFFFFVPGVAE